MENAEIVASDPPAAPAPPSSISVTVNVTAQGKPEDAAELAKAVVAAMKIVVPGASLG